MKTFLFLIVFILFISLLSKVDSESNDNYYLIYTKTGIITTNYQALRDDYDNGFGEYVDAITKEHKWVSLSSIDSVVVKSENFWTCGPRNKNIKYIDLIPK